MFKAKSNLRVKDRIGGWKGFGTVLAVALAALLLLAACAPTPTGPPLEKVVEIGDIAPLTGPPSYSEQICLRAELDYIRYFNEEIGIPGVTIEMTWIDTATNAANSVSAYRRFTERGVPVLWSSMCMVKDMFKQNCERDEVPMMFPPNLESLAYPPGWLYIVGPTAAESFAVVCNHIMENWKEDSPPKGAFMFIDDPYGYEPIEQGTKYAESIGIEMLPEEIVPFVPLDTTTQLLRLKERGADFIYIQCIPVASGPILRDAERLGLVGKIQFCGVEYSLGERVLEIAGPAAEGYLAAKQCPWFDETEIPGIKLMIDKQMKYHGKVIREPEYTIWGMMAVTCEAIRRAVEELGYENLDGRAIKEALDGMTGFDVYGLYKCTYAPEVRRGCDKLAIYQVRGGKIVGVCIRREAPILVPDVFLKQ